MKEMFIKVDDLASGPQRALIKIFTDDSDSWLEQEIEIYAGQYQGSGMDSVCVRLPAPAKRKSAGDEMSGAPLLTRANSRG